MLLKTIRILLITVFVLVAAAAGTLVVWHYTHDDISAPVFTSDYELIQVSVRATEEQLCTGLHAYDNVDGDISDRILVKSVSPLINKTDAIVTYLVYDNASNAATYTRTIRYIDYTAPHFALSKPLVYSVGDKITLLDRLTASDGISGDITNRILLTSAKVSNTTEGSYPITVQVTNSAGDTSMLTLTVRVEPLSASAPTLRLTDYLIYIKPGEKVLWSRFIDSVRDPMDPSPSTSKVIYNAENVDLKTPGTYEAYYYYVGQSGETATVILTVVVE